MEYQVVILAGGESSRFFPFNSLHKTFFKIAGKTILERTVESVKKMDPKEIILVLSSKNFDQEKAKCDENPIFNDVKYIKEDSPLGQADAILSAKEFINNDFFVINANQFNFDKIADGFIESHTNMKSIITLGIVETDNPSKYGIVELNGDRVRGIVEKPAPGLETSNFRVIGTYLFSKEVIVKLENTPLSQYSLETVLNELAHVDRVGSVKLSGSIPTLKYPWDILEVKNEILAETKFETDDTAVIEKTAVLKGDEIFIGKNAHICDYSIIESPAYIGDNAVVGAYCQIRGGSVLEEGAQAERYTDVKNSVIGEGAHIHSGFIGDSVIGKNAKIGAEFITANKRLDRKSVGLIVKGEMTDSGKPNVGVFIGEGAKIGIRVSTMPGTIIGENSKVFPGLTLSKTYGPGTEITK